MLVDANTAPRQKFNKIRHLGGGGGIENPDSGELGKKK
jgi:hypothetical protein